MKYPKSKSIDRKRIRGSSSFRQLNGYRVFRDNEKVLKQEKGGGHTTPHASDAASVHATTVNGVVCISSQ